MSRRDRSRFGGRSREQASNTPDQFSRAGSRSIESSRRESPSPSRIMALRAAGRLNPFSSGVSHESSASLSDWQPRPDTRSSRKSSRASRHSKGSKTNGFSYSKCVPDQILRLQELPWDILKLLPSAMPDIETLVKLSATSQMFYRLYKETLPNLIMRLTARSSLRVFRPSPYFLLAVTARKLGDWAAKNDANREDLFEALQEGVSALAQLNASVCNLTIPEIKAALWFRYKYIEDCLRRTPFASPISRFKTQADLDHHKRMVLFLSIYGDLFHVSFDHFCGENLQIEPLSIEHRIAFIQCMFITLPPTHAERCHEIYRYVDWFPHALDEEHIIEVRNQNALVLRLTVYGGWSSFVQWQHRRKDHDLSRPYMNYMLRKVSNFRITEPTAHNNTMENLEDIWPGLFEDFCQIKRRAERAAREEAERLATEAAAAAAAAAAAEAEQESVSSITSDDSDDSDEDYDASNGDQDEMHGDDDSDYSENNQSDLGATTSDEEDD